MADRDSILENVAKSEGYIDSVDMICVNGAIDSVKIAMDENGKQMCLDLLEYMAKNEVSCEVNIAKEKRFYFKGQWISKEELFENFL